MPSPTEEAAKQALDMYLGNIEGFPTTDNTIKLAHENAYRMLLAMVTHAPNQEGRDNIATAIIGCTDDEKRQKLGLMYRDSLILPCKFISPCRLSNS